MNQMNQPHTVAGDTINKSMKGIYTIIDKESGPSVWLRVGTAFENRDQSWNIILDATPVNGKLHMRDIKPRDTL